MATRTEKRLHKRIVELKASQAAAVRFAGQHKKRADFIQTAFKAEAPDQYAAWMAKQRAASQLKGAGQRAATKLIRDTNGRGLSR